ncbi:amino acid adenylation domain-containing protein [Campylobacter pinnipediorum]|uniref:Amino acid adenylation protein n=1 Tax=Campylobacter pinnipediorum subsp. pinnipediorum TaxID=1660067 RepID=A0AAX0L935_9BACT|nr:amino acid adenylation domain-containing protein [Campylobacter pinnipediorum]AQW83675.1 AMP-forming adenylation domain superfamily protein, putative D-alanine:D-alanyl carrier protein ligase [Campylobacter pinnipediorum subsp. pinnipediorum]OPA75945.1 amino acid adenylation protein [Campylobacter pinnipediorum subsp. pinnipediorum]
MTTSVCDFLDNTSSLYPDKIAFVQDDRNISYLEFNISSKKVASKILEYGVSRKPVLIMLPKSIECLVSFLGVARSGNFYTLIDENTPKERILKIVDTLKPSLLITSKENKLDFLDLPTIFCEDFKSFSIDENKLKIAKENQIDTDLLYVFFTSGSTGTPKGVSIMHKSVIDYTSWVCETFDITKDEVLVNQAPFYFDNSILDIFSTIKTGATLHIVPNSLFSFPIKIIEYIKKHKVSFIFWVPSVLIYFANTNAFQDVYLPYLKKVLFCGEPMPNKQLNILRKCLKDTIFANLYGPTEITDVCSYYICDRDFKDDEILPIGRACKNMQLLVFDDDMSLIDNNNTQSKGELYVRGTGLSVGYYGDKEKTNKAFIQNPLHDNYEDKIYKTGDIVKYNEHGELLCLGRSDGQIKVLGHRVELGEIESIINSHKDILNCACVFLDDKIHCFYESKEKIDIKIFLKDKLPSYMIPRKYIKLDGFRYNQNGKIDRQLLGV